MALDKTGLQAAIKNAFLNAYGSEPEPSSETEAAIDSLASDIADACDTFVKSATVVHVLTSPAGPVTGTITIT